MRILYVLVTALLITFFQIPSWALGIGSIDVHSSLGEPLSASIPLVDANGKTDAQCFKLRRQVDGFPSEAVAASIELKSRADGGAKLLIKSYQVFNDPIVELTVTTNCEDQLSRTYTVLLDPPLYESSEQAAVDVNKVSSGGAVIGEPSNVSVKPKKNKKRKKKQSSPARLTGGLVGGESTQPPVNASGNQAAQPLPEQNGTPKLIVSGDGANAAALALRFETTMSDTPPAETAGQSLELNDLSDDMTAMSKKLEHLESQLTKLQQRNQFLEAANKSKVAAPAVQANNPANSDEMPNWWVYVAICLLIIAVVACAEWYKRRKQNLHLEIDGDEEFDFADEAAEDDADPLQLNTNKLNTAAKASVASAKSGVAKTNAYTPQPEDDVTEVNEGILEQAEVFVAHGRSALAITLLQEHLKDFPKASPAPWLLLLSLLKRENKEADYIAAAEECRRYFNFYVPSFQEAVLEDNSSIEDYPNAKEMVVKSWGRPEVIPVLDGLIYNHRNEARQGFERSAYIDILLLRSIAQSQGLSDLSNISGISAVEEPSTKELGVLEEAIEQANTQENTVTMKPQKAAVVEEAAAEIEHMSFPPLQADLSGDPLGISSAEDNSLDFNLDWPVETAESEHAAAEGMTVTDGADVESITLTSDVDDEINKVKPADKSKPLDFNV